MKRAAPFVLLLFTFSGLSGLIYEIVWIRMLSHLLGGTSYAISTVLAAFMGGLALGSRFFGRRADRTSRPLVLYAKLEFGIAALGILVFLLARLAPPAYATVAGPLPGPVLALLRAFIAGVLLLPPTFLMGGTLPVLSRFIVKRQERLGRGLGLLYAVNTFGAVLGSFLTGFVLIASIGLAGCTALAVGINIAIGATIWFIDRKLPATAPETEVQEAPADKAKRIARKTVLRARTPGVQEAPTDKVKRMAEKSALRARTRGGDREVVEEMPYLLLALIFALTGFASLGYELYWTRALEHFLGNSTYAFTAMLTTFLLGLAAGGWLGGRWADRVASPSCLLAWVQIGVGACALGTVVLIWEWLPRLEDSYWITRLEHNWNAYLIIRFLAAFAVMTIPTLLIGVTFPVVNRIGIHTLSRLGEGVGGLYFANTLGAILGSLAAGFLLLPLLGAKGALVFTALLSAAIGFAVHLGRRGRRGFEPWLAGIVFAVFLVAGPVLNGAGRALLSDTQDPSDLVLFYAEDHAAETKVYRKPSGEIHMSVDAYCIGGTDKNLLRKEKVLAHLPMVLRPDARKTLSVGLGSGITLGTFALYTEVEDLSCAEIVPGVVEGARFFEEANRDVLRDARVRMIVGDGVQYLLTTRERFDIISSDSKLNPDYVGNATMLAKDYYELCRDRLSETGVMVQWLACHLPLTDVKVIVRSFSEVFAHVGLYWYNPNNIILAGSKVPLLLDIDAARAFASREAIATDLKEIQLDNPYAMASLWQCGKEALLAGLGDGPVNTWQRPRIEFTVSRNYLSKHHSYHEDDNIRWLRRIREETSQRLAGEVDPAIYKRFLFSARKLLDGFMAGTGLLRIHEGIASFEEGLAANPDDRRLVEVLADIRSWNEETDKAYAAGRVNSPDGLVHVGLRRMEEGRREEALALFERAYSMRPDDPNIQYNRLLAMKSLNRWIDFRGALAKFLKEFPREARGHSLRGRDLAENGNFEESVAAFERAIELDPENPVYYNNLATALARLHRYEEAARAFEEVCKRQPSFQNAAYFAAASYSMAGLTKEAARWARFCIEEGLVDPEKFATEPFFAKLRDSEHWDAERARPK